MQIKILAIDLSVIPNNWDIDKWIEYIEKEKKIFVSDTNKIKSISMSVSFWNWLRYNFGFNLKFNKPK